MMKTLEEAGNNSPLRLYLSGATPPLVHFANRTSMAPTDALFALLQPLTRRKARPTGATLRSLMRGRAAALPRLVHAHLPAGQGPAHVGEVW